MLDITDRDIADLNDTDLRALVALLAEATLRSYRLPASAVTWGGDQNAPDGGLDVRVELDSGTVMEGFIPRPETGYQVKKLEMPPAAIRSEMRPGGQLRESITRLVDRGGAYIIASSGSNLSDSRLGRRIAAMRSAIADHPNASNLTVDYFDRQRLATWVRDHPALGPWVRLRVGRPMQGWRSYGDWGFVSDGSPDGFIADETARLYAGSDRSGQPDAALSTLTGLQRMRAVLGRPASSLRLIGLSGVGKTRLVKALFDERVGTEALDPNMAIYADLAHHPEPTPVAVATYLLSRQARSIIIVDNCPAELHAQLTQLCRTPGSTVSLVTVEYDIREDTAEGTEVFRLEAASKDVVAKVVIAHCPWLSQVDAQSIGVFSGGNARVGLALAHTTRAGESLSGLTDEDLFLRLFRQRHDEDAGLRASAEACALVYSFDGETMVGDDSEIARLAALAECTASVLYRHIAELRRRGLLQERSQWRAVLPHAIANRLAARALENIPVMRVQEELVERASERLIKSYSRRLSYLHDSKAAARIAESWLSASGLLGSNIKNLSPLRMTLLTNIAPVAPESALAAIERAEQADGGTSFFSAENGHHDAFVRLIRKIAYDAALFNRCAKLIVKFASELNSSEKGRGDQIVDTWRSLFSPFLSGTHASVSQRMEVLDGLLRSDNCKEYKLAIDALAASLETFHFSSAHRFDFGARSRDYGYHPSPGAEQKAWFSAAVRLAMDIGTSTARSAPKVRALLARKLPGLWVSTATQDLLASAVEAFSTDRFWEDGWVAVKEAIWRSRDCPLHEAHKRLQALEARLAPKTLLENIQLYVGRDRNWIFESEDTDAIGEAMRRAEERAEELGRSAAADLPVLQQVLPDLARQGNGHRWHFARGLARAVSGIPALWSTLVAAVASNGQEANPSILAGYLSVWQELDPLGARRAIDAAIDDVSLRQWVPQLEAAIGLDGSSVERLTRALAAGAPAWAFRILSSGRLTDAMSPPDLANLLSALAAAPDGWAVAVDVLSMRLRSETGDHTSFNSLLSLGRTLLLAIEPRSKAHQRLDYDLSTLASTCLVGAAGEAAAIEICRTLAEDFGNHVLSFHEFHTFISAIFQAQPFAALDAFLVPPPEYAWRYPTVLSMFDAVSAYHAHPLKEVADSVILEWCAREPERNYAAAATSVPYCQSAAGGAGLAWTNVAMKILEKAPEPRSVLAAFIARFEPHSWSGSRAAIIESNIELIVPIEGAWNSDLATLARQERQRLLEQVRQERGWEMERSRHNDERFE